MTEAAAGPDLGVARRRPKTVLLAWLAVLVVVALVALWEAVHPKELPTSDRQVVASARAGQAVYVGVFAAPSDFGRTLTVKGVRVFATSSVPIDGHLSITPRLCRGGSFGVTTSPESFCKSLSDTEGSTLRGGDEIVLEVRSSVPGSVQIDPVRIAYREGWRWATQTAGSRSVVTIS